MKLRCSSLPLAFACPPSTLGDGISVQSRNDEAALGSAGHEAMEEIVAGQEPSIESIAERWRVELDQLERVVNYGRRAWAKLAPSFPAGGSEMTVRCVAGGIEMTGHVDLMTPVAPVVHGLDWKFGRLDRDYYHQLAGYATCILAGYPDVQRVIMTVVWCRDQQAETYTFDREKCAAWATHFKAQVLDRAEQYVTGEHCAHCPRSHSCPAIAALARRDVAIFSEKEPSLTDIQHGLVDLPPADVVALLRRAKVVSVYAEYLRVAVHNLVSQKGPLDAGDGTELAIVERPGRRHLEPQLAWPALQDRFTKDEIASATDVSITALEKIAATNAGKGKGAAAKRELSEALERRGAIRQDRIEMMISRRKDQT